MRWNGLFFLLFWLWMWTLVLVDQWWHHVHFTQVCSSLLCWSVMIVSNFFGQWWLCQISLVSDGCVYFLLVSDGCVYFLLVSDRCVYFLLVSDTERCVYFGGGLVIECVCFLLVSGECFLLVSNGCVWFLLVSDKCVLFCWSLSVSDFCRSVMSVSTFCW